MSLILLYLFSLLTTMLCEDRLIFVLTHFRHGARAPQKYFDDKLKVDYALEKWDSPGELTAMGKRMHYALGLRNRERYITNTSFLSPKFDPHEMLIYSTRFNRTLLSVAAQLQGLYPFGTGEELESDQIEKSKPPLNLSYDVESDLADLNNYSLPGKMSLAPIRMINDLERKMIIYDISSCLWKRDEMREKNLKNSEPLKKLVDDFFKNYTANLKKLYGTDHGKKFDIHLFDNFCDAFIAGRTELKEMKNLTEAGLNTDEMLKTCFEFMKLNFRDWISGDDERVLPTLESSKMMREMIHYMKQRIEADIKNENISLELQDYSRPKMIMVSAHDSTTSMWEMFLIKIFLDNNATKYYDFPTFATQLSFEVVRDKSLDNKTKTEDDYTINFYFNDRLFLNKSVNEFIKTVEDNLYSDEKINEICKFDAKKDDKEEEEKGLYFTLMIVFAATTGLFLILTIFFIIKATRSKNSELINKQGQLLNSYDGN